jgi:hypothetical protein
MRAVLTPSSWLIIITAWRDFGCMPLVSYMGSGIMTGQAAAFSSL